MSGTVLAKHTDTAEYIFGLKKNGVHHDPKTILRVMQKYGLLSVIRRKKYRNYGEYLHQLPKPVEQELQSRYDRIKSGSRTSHTYKTGQGTLYLSVIRDLYDNSIVVYKTGTAQNINLVLSTIRAAKRKEKRSLRSCNSTVTKAFSIHLMRTLSLTQSYHITPSMSRRGNPYDNAMAENFFSILKTECIYRVKLKTYEEASSPHRQVHPLLQQ